MLPHPLWAVLKAQYITMPAFYRKLNTRYLLSLEEESLLIIKSLSYWFPRLTRAILK
jgi:hypothetical protein